MAEWTTAYINDLPDSSFLYVEPGGEKDSEGKTTPRSLRHFPVKDANGNVDMPHLRNALSRIPQSSLPQPVKDQCEAKARRMMGERDMPAPDSEFRYQDALESLFSLREDTGSAPTLIGHFAVFDQWTEINSRFEGHFIERISPGAFDKTFAENRRNMRVLFQHGKDPHVGEKILGPIAELRAEDGGAYYEVPLYDTSYNRDLIPGLADNQYGASFRFRAMKEDWNDTPKRSEYNPDGLRERTITEAKVMEFGPVTFPAYAGSTAGLRSATDWYLEQALRNQIELFALRGTGTTTQVSVVPREVSLEEPQHSEEPSRRTRVDHLSTRKEDAPWRL